MINLKRYNLDLNETYIIGVSGGSDSMALLDMLHSLKLNLIVAHVNYHHRPTANRDEDIVKEYCATHSIPFYKYDFVEQKGNFQDVARNSRYNFFYDLYKKYNCRGLFVAHQKDDLVETYLFRKNRNSRGKCLSILEQDYIYNMDVFRPLLNYRKKDLEQYCATHSIKYGIDESNLKTDYSRNKIRWEIIDKLSDDEFDNLFKQIEKDEKEYLTKRNLFLNNITNNSIKLVDFLKLNDDIKEMCLIELIDKNCSYLADNLNIGLVRNAINSIQTNKNKPFKLEDNIYLIKSMEDIKIFKSEPLKSIVINNFKEIPNEYMSLNGYKMEGIYINENDFPITIRSFKNTDYIDLKEGHKSVKRLFVDNKISTIERLSWPILVNKENRVLLVKNLYRDYNRRTLKNNVYVIK